MKKKILFAALAICAICLVDRKNVDENVGDNLMIQISPSFNETDLEASVVPPRVPPRPTTPQQQS